MRIIKHGSIPEYKFKCQNCGTEFIFDQNDIHRTTREMGFITWTKLYFICPLCRQHIYFDKMTELDPFRVTNSEGEDENR